MTDYDIPNGHAHKFYSSKIKQHLLLHLICHWLPCFQPRNCYADSTHHQQYSHLNLASTAQKQRHRQTKRQSETLTPFSLIPTSLRKTSMAYELTTNISAFFHLSKNWKKRTDTCFSSFHRPGFGCARSCWWTTICRLCRHVWLAYYLYFHR